MEPATDLELLLKKGFGEEESKRALLETRGNLDAALIYLTKGKKSLSKSWSKETEGEWVDNVNSAALLTSTGRALVKSTYHLSVPRWEREDGQIWFVINAILRDGRQWKSIKKYPEIHEFWRSLPIGSTTHLKHSFPQPQVITVFRNQDDTSNEQRRQDLDDWFGELSMDERAMSNQKVVAALDRFLDADSHPLLPSNTPNISDLPNWVVIPDSTLTTFQVSLEELSASFPCKVNLADLFPQRIVSATEANVSLSVTGCDVTVKQITKDLSRDRIIIQGKRIEGSDAGLNGVLSSAIQAAETVIKESGGVVIHQSTSTEQQSTPASSSSSSGLVFSSEMIEEFCLTSLGQLGRTESAYASLSAITFVVNQAAQPDIILVPESILAPPLLMRFRVSNDKNMSNSNKNSSNTSSNSSHTSTHTNTTTTHNNNAAAQSTNKSYGSGVRASPLLGGNGTAARTATRTTVTSSSTAHRSPLDQPVQKRPSPLLAEPHTTKTSSTTSTTTTTATRRHSTTSTSSSTSSTHSNNSNHSPSTAAAAAANSTLPNPPAIICDMQATTVYRFAHFETMHTILQIKVTFCQSIKLPADKTLLAATATAASSSHSSSTNGSPEKSSTNKLKTQSSNPFDDDPIEPPQKNDDDNKEEERQEQSAPPVSEEESSTTKESEEEKNRSKEQRRKLLQRSFILSKSFVIFDRDTRTSTRDWN